MASVTQTTHQTTHLEGSAFELSTLHRALPQGSTPGARVCWGCGKEDQEKRFGCCPLCVEEQLAPAYFCSQQCQKDNWRAHKAWHKQSRRGIEAARAGFVPAEPEAIAAARASVDPFCQAEAKGHEALNEERFADAAKAYKKCIKINPDNPRGYFNLGNVYGRSGDLIGSLQQLLLAIPRFDEGEYDWGSAVINAFALLNRPECFGVARPSWWNDAELLILSRMALSLVKMNTLQSKNRDEHAKALHMRFVILDPGMAQAASSISAGWVCGERGVPELLEAISQMDTFLSLDACTPKINFGLMKQVLPMRIDELKKMVLRLGGDLAAEPSSLSIIGDKVVVNGLVQQPALNGAFVEVLSWNGANARYKVKKQDGSIIHVKPKNIAGGGAIGRKGARALARAAQSASVVAA